MQQTFYICCLKTERTCTGNKKMLSTASCPGMSPQLLNQCFAAGENEINSFLLQVPQPQANLSAEFNIFRQEFPNIPGFDFSLETARKHGRAILTEREAQEIFKHKAASNAKGKQSAAVLARFYGVSVKTVRDIWVGRTWYRSTFHLDPSKPILSERLEKKPGRPCGAKDSKPRLRHLHKAEISSPQEHHSVKTEENIQEYQSNNQNLNPTECIAANPNKYTQILTTYDEELRHTFASSDQRNGGNVGEGGDHVSTGAWSEACEMALFFNVAESAAVEAADLVPGWELPCEAADPFHNDWAFWPKDGQEAAKESAKI